MGALDRDMARNAEFTGGEPEKASEIVREVDSIFTGKTKDQKSNLVSRNVRGITRAMAFQSYMQKFYGFRITVLDVLVDNKLTVTKSRDGWGVDRLTQLMSTLQSKIETNIGMPQPGIMDKMAGNKR